uniref:Uncharacterized protein n=1 Tax=Leclercia adecarboxylata TaxID=83655 RepID=A0A482LYU5_9ENTR|nr:Hypothetical protein [Leclercia adecarboxylata]
MYNSEKDQVDVGGSIANGMNNFPNSIRKEVLRSYNGTTRSTTASVFTRNRI